MQALYRKQLYTPLEHINITGYNNLVQGQIILNPPLAIRILHHATPIGIEPSQQAILGQMYDKLYELFVNLFNDLGIAMGEV